MLETEEVARRGRISLFYGTLGAFGMLACLCALGFVWWQGAQERAALRKEFEETREIFASSTRTLAEELAVLENALHEVSNKNITLEEALTAERSRVAQFADDVEKIGGTVENLEKLSKTDPELLQKYSKVFFLNEHYAPERLVAVPEKYRYDESRTLRVHAGVWPFLEELLEEATRDDVTLYVFSAFRSFNEQSALKGQYTVTYGAGSANAFSADQGYSEHQLGTTVDFITPGIGGTLAGFGNTEAYEWLLANAYKHGFILSYPEGNAHYVFEPWHWRFVGKTLARDLHRRGEDFYDMDQRDIDAYLINFFE